MPAADLQCMQPAALPTVCLHLLRWGLLLWQARLAQIGSSASKTAATTAAATAATMSGQAHGVQQMKATQELVHALARE
jgi:hypothetical protein